MAAASGPSSLHGVRHGDEIKLIKGLSYVK